MDPSLGSDRTGFTAALRQTASSADQPSSRQPEQTLQTASGRPSTPPFRLKAFNRCG